jgi:HK97 gp10 family phage protein
VEIIAEITGVETLQLKLKQLPVKLGEQAMRRAVKKGAIPIRNRARSIAKQLDDPQTRSNIAKNIVVRGGGRRFEKFQGGPKARVGVLGGARDYSAYGELSGDGSGNPGGDTFHWRFLEFGTAKMQAKPILTPAMEGGAEAAFTATADAMSKETDKEIAKLGAK